MSELARESSTQRVRLLRSAARAAALALLTALAIGGCGAAPDPDAAGSPAASDPVPAQIGVPTRVEIPAIDVDEELVPVGLQDDGAMQTPDLGLAAWYELGPRPGALGPAVVLAFHRLRELAPGDRVTVHGQDGSATFVVDSSEQVDKDRLPYDRIWSAFDAGIGHHLDNVIVYAHLVGG